MNRTQKDALADFDKTLKEIGTQLSPATFPQSFGLILLGVGAGALTSQQWVTGSVLLVISLLSLLWYGRQRVKYVLRRDELFASLRPLLKEIGELAGMFDDDCDDNDNDNDCDGGIDDLTAEEVAAMIITIVDDCNGQVDDGSSEMVTLGHGVAIPREDYEKLNGVDPYSKEGQAILNGDPKVVATDLGNPDLGTLPFSEVERAMRGDDFKLPSERGSTVMASSTPTGSGISLINEITEERSSSSLSSPYGDYGDYGDYSDYGDYGDYGDYSDSSGGEDY